MRRRIEKYRISETDNWFFEKRDKIDKTLARLIKKKKTQITQIGNESRGVTTNLTKIIRLIREHCKQLYDNKLDHLQEMDKFLETHKLPKRTHEEIQKLNKPISKEIESEFKKKKKNPIRKSTGFIDEVYQTFKDLTIILFELFQKNVRGWNTS